jgi:hypothetical protein
MFDEIPSFYYIHLQRISKNDVFAGYELIKLEGQIMGKSKDVKKDAKKKPVKSAKEKKEAKKLKKAGNAGF